MTGIRRSRRANNNSKKKENLFEAKLDIISIIPIFPLFRFSYSLNFQVLQLEQAFASASLHSIWGNPTKHIFKMWKHQKGSSEISWPKVL